MSEIFTILMFIFLRPTAASFVEADEIKSAVSQYIFSRLDTAFRKDAIVEFRAGIERVSLSGRDHTLRVGLGEERTLRGIVCLPVEIASEGKVRRQMVVSVKIRLFGQVFIADQQLERHSNISDKGIGSRYMELTSMPDDVILSKDQLYGKRTSRIVGAGSVLRESSLELIPLVVRDESVTLIVRTGHVRLSTTAVAKEDGVFGSTIEVQKVDSHERIEAVVIDEHTVQVTME
jgi:flagella basal body P-ring formation protein FlgA